MTTEIDGKRAIELLREVVAEAGVDKTTDGCRYVLNDAPCCMVGQALYKVVGDSFLRIQDTKEAHRDLNGTSLHLSIVVEYLRDEFDVVFTHQAKLIFGAAQDSQDDYDPWGEALTFAEKEYSRGY